MAEFFIGNLSEHATGRSMKEMVRRAIGIIREQFDNFEVTPKLGHSGEMDDKYTTADTAAQESYVKMLTEDFPLCGVVAEESSLSIPCRLPNQNVFFTVDPLDGTHAYARRQSHGVGTMIALVVDGKVVAAFVGDANTEEIYGFRAGSEKTHRIREFRRSTHLAIDPTWPLSDQYVLLRHLLHKQSPLIRHLVLDTGVFRDAEVTGGSIGTSMARMWKSEVGACVLNAGANTPWDWCPIVGISQHLGFVFLEVQGDRLVQIEPLISPKKEYAASDVLVVHQSRLPELASFIAS